jgi:hypothetical protein
LQVIFQNDGSAPLYFDPDNFILFDSSGQPWYPASGSRADELMHITLNPGEQVIGWVSFSTSPGTMVKSLKYQDITGKYISIVLVPF